MKGKAGLLKKQRGFAGTWWLGGTLVGRRGMNIHRTPVEWEELAQRKGFTDMGEMLHYYYVVKGMTAKHIGETYLGVGKDRTAQLLRKYGIGLRPRGGAR